MQIAIVNNNVITKVGELKEVFSNVSFPATGVEQEWLASQAAKVVNYFKPYDNASQRLEQVEPYIENGEVFAVNVVSLTAEEITAKVVAKKAELRKQYETATINQLNKVVKEKDFDSIEEATSYITSSNATWKAESEAVVVWRDAVWAYFYAEMEKETPFSLSIDAIGEASPYIANMPTIAW